MNKRLVLTCVYALWAATLPLLALLPASLFLVGCATPVTKPVSPAKVAYLVTDFYSKSPGIKLTLLKQNGQSTPVAVFEVTPLDNFRVIELEPGKYVWQEAALGSNVWRIRDMFSITIGQGELNYIGGYLLKVNQDRIQIDVINQSTEVQRRLQEDYPRLFSQYPFVLRMPQQSGS